MPDRPAPGAQLPLVALRYRSDDGEEISLTLPAPAAPALLRLLELALAKRGYVRVDDEEPS